MSEDLFGILKDYKLTTKHVSEVVNSWEKRQLEAFLDECSEAGKPSDDAGSSLFSFFSSSQLSGGPWPCMTVACRLKRTDWLSRFAALYADRIFIKNPFGPYPDGVPVQMIRDHIAQDITILDHMQPLAKAGIIDVASNKWHFCRECARERGLENRLRSLDKRFRAAHDYLYTTMSREMRFKFRLVNSFPFLEVQGAEEFIGDERVFFHPSLVKSGRSSALSFGHASSGHNLTAKEVARLGILDNLSNVIMGDLFVHDWYSYLYRVNYITDRPVDSKVICVLGGTETGVRSKALYEGISHALPILEGIDIKDLVRFRRKEEESFRVYRDSLAQTLKSVADERDPVAVRDAFKEEVQPEINRLNQLVTSARRECRSRSLANAIVGTGFIGIGLFSGLLPSDIGTIVASLGGLEYFQSLADTVRGVIKVPDEVKTDKYYFLWKLASGQGRQRQ